jgi:hypothetical protein
MQNERRLLADSPVVRVAACDCGTVHLHFGPMSLRFTRNGLEALRGALEQACRELQPVPVALQ